MVIFKKFLFSLLLACIACLGIHSAADAVQYQQQSNHTYEEIDLLALYFQFHSRNNNTEVIEATFDRLEKLSGGNPLSYAGLHKTLLEFEILGSQERFNEAIEVARELISHVEQTPYEELLGFVYLRYSQALLTIGQLDEANIFFSKADSIASNYPDNNTLNYHTEHTRAYLNAKLGNYAGAFELFLGLINELNQKLEQTGELIHKVRLAGAYGSLALEMANMEIADEAILYLNKALEISREINDYSQISRHLNNLNVAYDRLGETHKAMEVLLEARELAVEMSNLSTIVRVDYNIGLGYMNLDDPENALVYFNNGLELSRELDMTPGVMHHSYGLASANKVLGNLETARIHAIESERLAIQLNSKPILSNTYFIRYLVEKQASNYQDALRYHELFKELDDEYKEVARSQALDELMVQHRVESTRAENEYLANQLVLEAQTNRQKNFFIFVFALLFFITVGFTYYLFKIKRQLQKAYGVLDVQNSRIARKNEKLEQLSQQRNAFLQVIVHDLRNPLSTIDGASQILQLNENKDTPDELRELTEIIASASKRMNLLISSLLNIFEKDSKSIETELTILNTKEFVNKIVSEFKPLATQKNITVSTELDEHNLTAHKDSLIGILSNLISNAIKYSPVSSTVTIISRVRESSWEIIIRDQGPGFSADDLENIFKPFARLSATPTGDETSTGVGLYSVKTSVLRMNGEIFVNQDYKDGAEFVCRIPVEVGEKELQATEDSSAF